MGEPTTANSIDGSRRRMLILASQEDKLIQAILVVEASGSNANIALALAAVLEEYKGEVMAYLGELERARAEQAGKQESGKEQA